MVRRMLVWHRITGRSCCGGCKDRRRRIERVVKCRRRRATLVASRFLGLVKGNHDRFWQDILAVHFPESLKGFICSAETYKAKAFGLLCLWVLHDSSGNDTAVRAKMIKEVWTLDIQVEVFDVQIRVVHRNRRSVVLCFILCESKFQWRWDTRRHQEEQTGTYLVASLRSTLVSACQISGLRTHPFGDKRKDVSEEKRERERRWVSCLGECCRRKKIYLH